MSPEDILERALEESGLTAEERRGFRAEFRRALLERDIEVIEGYVYGEGSDAAESYIGGSDGECDSSPGPVRMTASRRYRLGL